MESWNDWNTNLRESLQYRKEEEKNWTRWNNSYRLGGQVQLPDGSFVSADEAYFVPLIRALLSIILPALYFRNPYVIVKPMALDSEDNEYAAQAMEAYVNYYLQGVIKCKKPIRQTIISTLVNNKGFLGIRWRPAMEDVGTKEGGKISFNSDAPENAPYFKWVSVWDATYDPYTSNGLSGSRWYAERVWVPTDYIRFNTSFNKNLRAKFTEPDRISPIRRTAREMVNSLFNPRKANTTKQGSSLDIEMEGLTQLWTVYDRKYDRMMVFSPRVEGFLVDDENPYSYLPDFPVTMLSFDYDVDVDQESSLVELLMPQQREHTHICQRQHEDMKRFTRQLEVVDGAFVKGEQGLKEFKAGKDGHVNIVKERGLIGGVEIPNTKAPEWWALRNGVVRDASFTLGIPPTQTGTGHDKFKSATEVSLVQKAFDMRIEDLREIVSDWMEQTVKVLSTEIMNMASMEKKMTIAGEERTIKREELFGTEFRFQVLLSEAAPENEMKRIQRAERIYQASATDPMMDKRKATMNLLRAYGEQNPEYYLAVSQMIPGNMPMPGMMPGGGGEGTPMESVPQEMQPGITGGLGELLGALGGGGE